MAGADLLPFANATADSLPFANATADLLPLANATLTPSASAGEPGAQGNGDARP